MMLRFLCVLFTVAGVTFANPSMALSFQVTFPNLTFPPKPDPDTDQTCSDLTICNGDVCTGTSR